MEKEIEMSIPEESGVAGTIQIADEVVGAIAYYAAMEIEGVAAINGNLPGEVLSKVAKKVNTRGVRVEVLGKKVRVELAITMEYGYNIPSICNKVQDRVKNAIENMTGLTVTDVNVRIAGINTKGN